MGCQGGARFEGGEVLVDGVVRRAPAGKSEVDIFHAEQFIAQLQDFRWRRIRRIGFAPQKKVAIQTFQERIGSVLSVEQGEGFLGSGHGDIEDPPFFLLGLAIPFHFPVPVQDKDMRSIPCPWRRELW